MNLNLFISIFFSTFFSFIITKTTLPFFRKYLLDNPNYRSSHIVPTPKGGGIIFTLVGSIFSIISGNNLPLFCIPLAIVGFLDDYKNVKNSAKYLVQLLTIGTIFFNSEFFFNLINNSGINSITLIFIIIFFVILGTAIINFINFMDGIDGMVSGSFLIIFISVSILIDSRFLVFVAAIVPFLIYNWYPAKIFMGDVGSTFLGALFYGIIVNSGDAKIAIGLLIMISPLLVDPIICIFRRFSNRENIFRPHRMHLYQRLVQAGWLHSKVSLIYILSIMILSVLMIFNLINIMIIFAILNIFIGIFLEFKKAYPFRKLLKTNN